jgi:sec-independent protein translocase protein TatA
MDTLFSNRKGIPHMYLPLMFMTPGLPEILLILLIVIILFGAKKLPDLARSLGKSLGEFKKGKAEGEEDDLANKSDPKGSDEKAEEAQKE